MTFLSVVLVLGTLINVAWTTERYSPEYRLEEFAKSPGIYYENLGKAVLYSTTWKTVVYLPLKTVTNQLDTLNSYVDYVNQPCSTVELRSWTACNHLDQLTLTKLRQVRESERLIASTVGRRDMEGRKKRGLFDFVGKVSKIIFGTMDGDDAQYYNEQTEHFERSSDSLTYLLKQQLTIVRSTVGAINEKSCDVTYNEDRINAVTRLCAFGNNAVWERYESAIRKNYTRKSYCQSARWIKCFTAPPGHCAG